MIAQVDMEEGLWRVELNDHNEVSMAFKETNTWPDTMLESLWRSWDCSEEDVIDYEWSYTAESVIRPPLIFQLVQKLIEALCTIVKRTDTSYFYFTPTDGRRGRLYSRLCQRILLALGEGWTCQQVDGFWFYFFKADAVSKLEHLP